MPSRVRSQTNFCGIHHYHSSDLTVLLLTENETAEVNPVKKQAQTMEYVVRLGSISVKSFVRHVDNGWRRLVREEDSWA